MRVGYSSTLVRKSLDATDVLVMNEAIEAIGNYWNDHDRLPLTDEGGEVLRDYNDSAGHSLHYQLVNRRNFVITSDGADQEFMTQYDVRALVHVTSLTIEQQEEIKESASDRSNGESANHPWIVIRKAEIDAKMARQDGNSTATVSDCLPDNQNQNTLEIVKQNRRFQVNWEVGGATTLGGAAYFQFFTWLMLGTSLLFVGIGYLYKPKTYIQDTTD